MGKQQIDKLIRRKMYWSFELEEPTKCPNCSTTLREEYQSFLIRMQQGNRVEEFTTGGKNHSSYCPKCPIIVLDHNEFGEIGSLNEWSSEKFSMLVFGIIDLESVAPSHTSEPLGTKQNPIPLVPFTGRISVAEMYWDAKKEEWTAMTREYYDGPIKKVSKDCIVRIL